MVLDLRLMKIGLSGDNPSFFLYLQFLARIVLFDGLGLNDHGRVAALDAR